jgi:predicted secreted hydrolase
MNKQTFPGWIFPLVLLVILVSGAASLFFRPARQDVQAGVIGLPVQQAQGEFETVMEPRELIFPRDHGPHPGFRTEWWYYTGNLSTPENRRFGYQLTFFRRAVLPESDRPERASAWAAEQVYMAHFTLSDVAREDFHYFERFERGAAGLAGAAGDPSFSVWLHDWSVEQVSENTFRLRAAAGDVSIDLNLTDAKGIILQGDRGYSQKGPQAGNASLYYSQTRLESTGKIRIANEAYPVAGLSWLDREISTSALSPGQVGWDWFALQLDDGAEVMAYVLRRSDGTIDAFSSATYIRPDGSTLALGRDDFQIISQGVWRSPHSGGEYPARWTVRIPAAQVELDVRPLLADQELNVSFTYWEGAVEVQGRGPSGALSGFGYVELTGYAESMEGDL